jgi:hypothetical protein
MEKMTPLWIALLALALLALSGCQSFRSTYESAPYQVVRADGDFEVRDYPALTVVEAPMAAPGSGADGSFRRLFRFISGGNEAKQKIAMTTPVFMSGGGADATMAFVLPAKLKAGDAPKPADATLRVRELPPGRFVVLRFTGWRNADNEIEALARLREWAQQQQLGGTGAPVFAYFDPPWTPPFWRRNEVMLPLAP